MRSSVDLPQPDGPSDRDELAGRDREVDAIDRDDVGLAGAAEDSRGVLDLDRQARSRPLHVTRSHAAGFSGGREPRASRLTVSTATGGRPLFRLSF